MHAFPIVIHDSTRHRLATVPGSCHDLLAIAGAINIINPNEKPNLSRSRHNEIIIFNRKIPSGNYFNTENGSK